MRQKDLIVREITPEKALNNLMALCSKSEKCSFDVKNLLMRWDVEPAFHNSIIEKLENMGFLSDERYADAFVRYKMSYDGWGERKIYDALRAKRIASEVILKAMTQIDDKLQTDKLISILSSKIRNIKAKNSYELKGKLIRFALSRGFQYDAVISVVENMVKDIDS